MATVQETKKLNEENKSQVVEEPKFRKPALRLSRQYLECPLNVRVFALQKESRNQINWNARRRWIIRHIKPTRDSQRWRTMSVKESEEELATLKTNIKIKNLSVIGDSQWAHILGAKSTYELPINVDFLHIAINLSKVKKATKKTDPLATTGIVFEFKPVGEGWAAMLKSLKWWQLTGHVIYRGKKEYETVPYNPSQFEWLANYPHTLYSSRRLDCDWRYELVKADLLAYIKEAKKYFK